MKAAPTFIDLFSGCGGLSLGLLSSGWRGLFAVERSPHAFSTYRHNLVDNKKFNFDWPSWLPCREVDVEVLIKKYSVNLKGLKGKVDLIAGGPPCQGFSPAGRRNPDDPRNKMAENYIKIVKIVKPKMLLLENVRGFNIPFNGTSGNDESIPYSEVVKRRLEAVGYNVEYQVVLSADWGVPQLRPRFILIAVRSDIGINWSPFITLKENRKDFLLKRGLNPNRPVTVKQAIDDLKVSNKELIDCIDSDVKGFKQILYRSPKGGSRYIKLMRKGMKPDRMPNSLRIPKHRPEVIDRFSQILTESPKGKSLSPEIRAKFKLKKHTITPLCPNKPAATITTLPDDILHYEEPRIPTVREMARLQSFPDWFDFLGRYTTGGKFRREMCPRYTQVGNAVPPLLGEALGELMFSAMTSTRVSRREGVQNSVSAKRFIG
ncbi:DNA cytosine methyltransferase [Microbulbifer sp. OS29]|uniref:Cytosine-specific methyltransferase n=1 Tax=Microbulbifer okhotskensis TaxID=2926617 RepID=A0A9X2ENQ4_9GAMM|nr:DNA cytosine methyltransferase [Microbulbifer okhotskensis]MCO1334535.1 DNA cytosine methyltransferase [Microbulbifer okhotskensis]